MGAIGIVPNTGTFSVGCENAPNPSQLFKGLVGSVRITSGLRYLSPFQPEQVLTVEDNTTLLRNFSDGTAQDQSGNGFHGAPYDATTTEDGLGCA